MVQDLSYKGIENLSQVLLPTLEERFSSKTPNEKHTQQGNIIPLNFKKD